LADVSATFGLARPSPDAQPSAPMRRRLGEKTHGGQGAPARS
jgi:hypothetical protein